MLLLTATVEDQFGFFRSIYLTPPLIQHNDHFEVHSSCHMFLSSYSDEYPFHELFIHHGPMMDIKVVFNV